MKNCCLPLVECIRNKMNPAGFISYAEYMAMALYHPEYGYYQNLLGIGEQGDFTTAPEISPLFAKALAQQCYEVWQAIGSGEILELGGGTGQLALQLLTAFKNLGIRPKKYYLFEVSKSLKRLQKTLLQEHYPEYESVFEWLDAPPQHFTGIILANEVLDALPVHCFSWQNQILLERTVSFQNGHFGWSYQQPCDQLQQAVSDLPIETIQRDFYESEINLGYQQFIKPLTDHLCTGVIIFIDYGYGAREYYHPQRTQGTLTCFYKHQKNNDPFQYIGYQDMTAHVDFTALTQVIVEQGLSLAGFTTQAAFLLSCGLAELVAEAEANLTEAEKVQLHQGVKQLTFPTEMGERIKVICFEKNLTLPRPLYGFRLHDRRRDL